jgi:ectoine hydroxylase-related dioxygenase (phytanoyl-CoA dioxygenase family)
VNKHKIEYKILNRLNGWENLNQEIEVHATPEEIKNLDKQGYLIRENLLDPKLLETYRTALAELEQVEIEKNKQQKENEGWGVFIRHMLDKNPIFVDLIQFPPVLSVVKAMMGPLVRLRGLSARISYPSKGQLHQTPMHTHLRTISSPLPPWFSQPHGIDVLIYLDDLNEERGTVTVIPGSHKWLDKEPGDEHNGKELELQLKAGSAIILHSNIWHKANPTISEKRRVLILSYTPTWLRESPYGELPKKSFRDELLKGASRQLKELLGVEGFT